MRKLLRIFLLIVLSSFIFCSAVYSQRFHVEITPVSGKPVANALQQRNLAGSTLAPNLSYPTPNVFTINTPIRPLAPQNLGGFVPASEYGTFSVFAGNGTASHIDGQGTSAGMYFPTTLATDALGNIYVCEELYGDVRKITPNGQVTTFCSIDEPAGIAVDPIGNIYVSSLSKNVIYKISASGAPVVFAGSGFSGNSDGIGNQASFSGPAGLTADVSGNIYVADSHNSLIRKISPIAQVTTIAGDGTDGYIDATGRAARFNGPVNLVIDKQGNLFVADAFNNRIREVSPSGQVTTFAGRSVAASNDGTGTDAGFSSPDGMTMDLDGNIYVTDNNDEIREITPTGVVTTLAGTGLSQLPDIHLSDLAGIVYVNGSLYVSDINNSNIDRINLTGYTIDKALPPGLTFDPNTGIISGTPTTTWPQTVYVVTGYNAYGSSVATVIISVLDSALPPAVITFPPLSQSDQNGNITPMATSTNTETPIVYTSSDPTVASITPDGLIHLLKVGYTTITATQQGNAYYGPAVPKSQNLRVYEYLQLTYLGLADKTICDADFPVGAVSNVSSIPLTYESSDPTVATVSADGIIHIVGPGTTTITVNQTGDGILYITAPAVSHTLTVYEKVQPTVSINPQTYSACDGMSLTYNVSGTNLGDSPQYQWQVNGVDVPGANSSSFTSSTLQQNDQITCVVSNINSCSTVSTLTSASATLTTTPYTTPTVSIVQNNTAPCVGVPLTFMATPVNGGTDPLYQWQVNGVNAGTNSSTFTTSSLNSGDVVTCNMTNQGGACLTTLFATSNHIAVFLSAKTQPDVTIITPSTKVYGGINITFSASSDNAVAGAVYQWQVNGSNAGINSTTFTSSTLKDGDQVSCIITGTDPCTLPATSNVITMSVTAPTAIVVPNAFTPNGDGINDLWNISALAYYPNCMVSVYNRYGVQVYQNRSYSRPWDGTANGGQVPTGTYYYIIDLGVQSAKLSGYVSVIR